MKVKIIKGICNPALGNFHPGQEVDFPDEVAEQRIAAGHCVAVDEQPKRLLDRRRRRGGRADDEPRDDEPQAKPIDKMTVAELEAYAADKGIDLGGASLKRDILTAIERAQDAQDADE